MKIRISASDHKRSGSNFTSTPFITIQVRRNICLWIFLWLTYRKVKQSICMHDQTKWLSYFAVTKTKRMSRRMWPASENRWCMMMSTNGNIFRVTGHLCGEFNGHRWIPRPKGSDAELWSEPEYNGWVNNGEADDFRRHRARYDFIVMGMAPRILWRMCRTLHISTDSFGGGFVDLDYFKFKIRG